MSRVVRVHSDPAMKNDDEIFQEELNRIWSELRKNKPIVFLRDNEIIRQYSDGTEEVLKEL